METLITQDNIETKPAKQRRGFAMLDASRRQEIARKGGKLAHALGRAHKFTRDEAKLAGRKGGLARRVQPANETLAS